MKKIINKNMQQQLFQALFGTIAVKIPLNKAGTFAAPIRATAKVVESLLKFANKRSFNLFVFASAIVLNVGIVGEARAEAGCVIVPLTGSDPNRLDCYDDNGNKIYSENYASVLTYDDATKTYTSAAGSTLTFDTENKRIVQAPFYSSGPNKDEVTIKQYDANWKMTSKTRTNSDGSGDAYTYDPNTGRMTSEAYTNTNGYTHTTTYDGNGIDNSNITGRTLTDSKGKPVNGTVTSGNNTYTAENGVWTGYTHTESSGSGYAYTYDPNTGRLTSYTSTSSNGSSRVVTYDPNTGYWTSEADTNANGYTRTTTYDGNGLSDSNITGGTLTDSKGKPVTGTYTSGNYTYTDGVLTGYTKTYSDGSGYARTYDPNTGRQTSYTNTNSDGSGYARTYDPNTGRQTSYTQTNSDGSSVAYTYDPDTGRQTSYTQTNFDGTGWTRTYDPTTGKITSDTYTNSDGSSYTYTYDPNTGRQTSYTETYSNGSSYTKTYDPNTGSLTSETYYDAEGNQIDDGILDTGSSYVIVENGKKIADIKANASCDLTSDGLIYCISYDTDFGKCAAIIKNSSGRVVGTQVCKSGEFCRFGSGKTASDCTTQFYSSDGKVIATYGEDGQPEKAYDYDGDGNKLVYNDQCAFVGKLDAGGNSIYDVGDGLSSENRRTRYTPAEAAEIIGNSDDNMIVMYFK